MKGSLFLILGLAPLAAHAVCYVSGGVGVENRDEMKAVANQYNLHIVFSQNETGAYLADVPVSIRNSAGEEILNIVSQGPWLYARLPEGAYTVIAGHDGDHQRRQVEIAGGESKALFFNWSKEPTV